ncbi:MAG: phosphate ABC transporter permease subunit PstC [Chloroflexi bacterium]|nr:phosphate ABC transporter permease subunit PstC [Chloroflexota bacterium]
MARNGSFSSTLSTGTWKKKGVGRRADSLFAILAAVCGSLVLLALAYMVVSTTRTAFPAFRAGGISFVFGSNWDPGHGSFEILPFIYGTIVTSIIALIVSVPLSIGVALFLTEYAPKWLRTPIEYAVDLLAAVPSVVYGLWGLLVVLPYVLRPVGKFLSAHIGFIPMFSGPSTGLSYFAAGIILSIMITPIITSITREVFRSVPSADRYAAFALGATRWEMIKAAVFPRSRAGIIGATMLGLGRALGETIVVAMLIGSSPEIHASIFKAGGSIAGLIANNWGEATGNMISALVAAGVVLFVITIIVNMIARVIVWRFNRA